MTQVKVTIRSRLSGTVLKEQWLQAKRGSSTLENEIVFITRTHARLMSNNTLDYSYITFAIKQNTVNAFNAMHPRMFYRDVTDEDIYLEVTRGWHEMRRLPNPQEPDHADTD